VTSILGLDISSFQLNGALLIDDQPPILRCERLGNPKDNAIERLRGLSAALRPILRHPVDHEWIDWVVIEDSFGRGRFPGKALDRVTGGIVALAPSRIQVAIISTGDWRKALGAKNTKADGHRAVFARIAAQKGVGERIESYDEHELDACGIAYAWGVILAGQVSA
jgi:hypothetical protein